MSLFSKLFGKKQTLSQLESQPPTHEVSSSTASLNLESMADMLVDAAANANKPIEKESAVMVLKDAWAQAAAELNTEAEQLELARMQHRDAKMSAIAAIIDSPMLREKLDFYFAHYEPANRLKGDTSLFSLLCLPNSVYVKRAELESLSEAINWFITESRKVIEDRREIYREIRVKDPKFAEDRHEDWIKAAEVVTSVEFEKFVREYGDKANQMIADAQRMSPAALVGLARIAARLESNVKSMLIIENPETLFLYEDRQAISTLIYNAVEELTLAGYLEKPSSIKAISQFIKKDDLKALLKSAGVQVKSTSKVADLAHQLQSVQESSLPKLNEFLQGKSVLIPTEKAQQFAFQFEAHQRTFHELASFFLFRENDLSNYPEHLRSQTS